MTTQTKIQSLKINKCIRKYRHQHLLFNKPKNTINQQNLQNTKPNHVKKTTKFSKINNRPFSTNVCFNLSFWPIGTKTEPFTDQIIKNEDSKTNECKTKNLYLSNDDTSPKSKLRPRLDSCPYIQSCVTISWSLALTAISGLPKALNCPIKRAKS